jgi:hypothetical protein
VRLKLLPLSRRLGFCRDRDLHGFSNQGRIHPDFFRLLLLPVEALREVDLSGCLRAGLGRRGGTGLRVSRGDDEGGEDDRKARRNIGDLLCEWSRYQSNFTPTRISRGGTTLIGRSHEAPELTVMFCSALLLVRL